MRGWLIALAVLGVLLVLASAGCWTAAAWVRDGHTSAALGVTGFIVFLIGGVAFFVGAIGATDEDWS